MNTTLQTTALSALEQKVYSILEDRSGYLHRQKHQDEVFIGSESIDRIAAYNNFNAHDVKHAIITLKQVGLITPKDNNKLYTYYTVTKPEDIDINKLNKLNKAIEEKTLDDATRLDNAIKKLFQGCNSLQDFVQGVLNNRGKFSFNREDIMLLSKESNINTNQIVSMITDIVESMNLKQPEEQPEPQLVRVAMSEEQPKTEFERLLNICRTRFNQCNFHGDRGERLDWDKNIIELWSGLKSREKTLCMKNMAHCLLNGQIEEDNQTTVLDRLIAEFSKN